MQRGFTLLELMVAIAVFAVMGLMSAQLLTNMIRQHELIGDRGQQLVDLQRAMMILERDIGQMWPRTVRDNYGDAVLPEVAFDDFPLEFTRVGWRNPLGHRRSDLQRVAYEQRDTTLYRYYWSVLDRDIETEANEQVLLEDVLLVEFEPLDGAGDVWIPGNAAGPDPTVRLAAIRMRLETENYGEITRLWEVPDSMDNITSPAPGGARAAGTGAPGTANGPGSTPGNGTPNASGSGDDDRQDDPEPEDPR